MECILSKETICTVTNNGSNGCGFGFGVDGVKFVIKHKIKIQKNDHWYTCILVLLARTKTRPTQM